MKRGKSNRVGHTDFKGILTLQSSLHRDRVVIIVGLLNVVTFSETLQLYLLHCDTFCQISRHINITALHNGNMIG